jgi:hypothetical protein
MCAVCHANRSRLLKAPGGSEPVPDNPRHNTNRHESLFWELHGLVDAGMAGTDLIARCRELLGDEVDMPDAIWSIGGLTTP